MESPSSIRDWIDKVITKYKCKLVVLDPIEYDKAIIGISYDFKHLLYDYDKLVQIIAQMHCNDSDESDDKDEKLLTFAIDYMENKVIHSIEYMGIYKPIIINKRSD
jgi:hypothetical protein